mgnify:CR=1 FL=1
MKDVRVLLKQVPLFEDFDEQELASVAPLFAERQYRKGTILFFDGDPGHDMFIIKKGLVKIYKLAEDKEITLALLREGGFFGEMSLFQPGDTRSATAETIEPTTVYTLSRASFQQFLEGSPKLCLKLLMVTAQRLRKANEQIQDLTFLDVRSRIVKVIRRLADDYGKPIPGGILVDVRLTHQQIANLAGTVRESVTKVLQELQETGIIDVDQKRITVHDKARLA